MCRKMSIPTNSYMFNRNLRESVASYLTLDRCCRGPMSLPCNPQRKEKINLHKNDIHILYRSVLLRGLPIQKWLIIDREREQNKKDEFLIFHDQITNAEAWQTIWNTQQSISMTPYVDFYSCISAADAHTILYINDAISTASSCIITRASRLRYARHFSINRRGNF